MPNKAFLYSTVLKVSPQFSLQLIDQICESYYQSFFASVVAASDLYQITDTNPLPVKQAVRGRRHCTAHQVREHDACLLYFKQSFHFKVISLRFKVIYAQAFTGSYEELLNS